MKIKKRSSIDKKSDKRLLYEIWHRLLKIDTIRSLEVNNISVDVDGGEVLLKGHLATDGHKQQIESIVSKIPDVISVKNELVSDHALQNKVAKALAKDPRTRALIVYVGVFHGWVHLSGRVSSDEDLAAVEEIAASVPEVRGVVTLPHLATGETADKHNVVQPSIGSKVYDHDNSPGRVYRVVIDPYNRLVIGTVVEADRQINGRKEKCYFVIASHLIRAATPGGVILGDSIPDMTLSSLFNQDEYLVPPEDWRPPFPYKPGEVLWLKGVSHV